jgi:hypothetical protein
MPIQNAELFHGKTASFTSLVTSNYAVNGKVFSGLNIPKVLIPGVTILATIISFFCSIDVLLTPGPDSVLTFRVGKECYEPLKMPVNCAVRPNPYFEPDQLP